MNRTAPRAFLGLLLAFSLAGCSGCADTPYKKLARGYRAVNLSARLVEDFDSAVARYLSTQHETCKAKYKSKTPEFDQCVLPAVKLARAWTGKVAGKDTGKGVLPTIQSAQKAARVALDAAYDYIKSNESLCKSDTAPKDCTGNWQALMKPSLCALAEIVDRGVKLGAYKVTGNTTYGLVMEYVKTFSCPK